MATIDPITERRIRAIAKEENAHYEGRLRRVEDFSFGNGKPGADEKLRNYDNAIAELLTLSKTLQPMILFYKVGVWGGTIIGASILILIWSLITGQAKIVFP